MNHGDDKYNKDEFDSIAILNCKYQAKKRRKAGYLAALIIMVDLLIITVATLYKYYPSFMISSKQAEKSLNDKIVVDLSNRIFKDADYDNNANLCSRLDSSCNNLEGVRDDKYFACKDLNLACKALDLRLSKLGYSFGSASLIDYINRKRDNDEKESKAKSEQDAIEKMANGQ